jgi:hypothetical protein
MHLRRISHLIMLLSVVPKKLTIGWHQVRLYGGHSRTSNCTLSMVLTIWAAASRWAHSGTDQNILTRFPMFFSNCWFSLLVSVSLYRTPMVIIVSLSSKWTGVGPLEVHTSVNITSPAEGWDLNHVSECRGSEFPRTVWNFSPIRKLSSGPCSYYRNKSSFFRKFN